ncbi:MAG: response regulator [Balneolia bacterium]|nr:response regulator [Balneolia bacterium]
MKFHLLIVDDDKIILMLHKRIVMREQMGENPQSFLNGKEALEYIKRHNSADDLHLVLLDINMPVMNGWQFLDALEAEELKAAVHVAMVTSSTDHSDLQTSRKYARVFDFLVKPLAPESLARLKQNPILSKVFTS